MHGQVITISGCWKQTSAILELYSRFRRTLHHHRHVILHWPTKFYANRMIADGVMTSYWFYKMAAIASQIYFRFLVWPPLTCRKAQGYRCTKFRPDISIHGRYITTSGFWKQTAAILKFNSCFNFDPFTAIGMWFSIGVPNFIKIGLSAAELWRHSDFQDGVRQPCWIWFRAMVAHPRRASGGLCFILSFRLDRIYSFGDRAIFIFWHFGLKLPIHAHF